MSLLAALLAMLSVVLFAGALSLRRDRRVATLVGTLSHRSASPSRTPRAVLVAIARRMPGPRHSGEGRRGKRLARRMELAGSAWSIEEVAGLKVVLLAAAAALALLGAASAPAMLGVMPALAASAYRVPDLVLARRARSRQASIELRVPDLVEVLVAATEAGLAPAIAFERASEVLRGPIGEELRRAVGEIHLGLPWRAAMDRLVERTDVAPLRRLVSALARSNRLGTSVRGTLRSVATDLRAERSAHAEELARRAPVKMLFPLVFLILPAFLLLTVGPVVLATIRSLRSG